MGEGVAGMKSNNHDEERENREETEKQGKEFLVPYKSLHASSSHIYVDCD